MSATLVKFLSCVNFFLLFSVYPNNCSICLVAIGDDYEYQSNVAFWDDIGGNKYYNHAVIIAVFGPTYWFESINRLFQVSRCLACVVRF